MQAVEEPNSEIDIEEPKRLRGLRPVAQVFAFDVVSKGALGVLNIVFIRTFSPHEFASLTFATAAILLMVQIFSSSLTTIFVVGHDKLNVDVKAGVFSLQFAGLAVFILLGLPFWSQFNGAYPFICLVIAGTFLIEFRKAWFQRELKFLQFSTVELTRVLLYVAGVIGLFFATHRNMTVSQLLSVQAGAMFIAYWAFRGRDLDGVRFRLDALKQLGNTLWTSDYKLLFLYFAFMAVLVNTDVFMLKALSSPLEVASYGSAFRYYQVILLLLTSLSAVFLPMLQKFQTVGELNAIMQRQKTLLLISVPVILFGAGIAQWLIPIIDNGNYPEAIPVFRILSVSAILSIALSPHAFLLMRFEQFRYLVRWIASALVISTAVHFLLIPRFGATGAAWATLIGFGLLNGAIFLKASILRREFNGVEAPA